MFRDEDTVGSGLAALTGDGRRAFFALLVKDLSITVRALYADAQGNGVDIKSAVAGVAEVLHTIGNQLVADAGLGAAPGDEEFLTSLVSKADCWGLGGEVRRAIQDAARRAG